MIPQTPKEFALYAIAPYFKDPSICAFENRYCKYLTEDGRKCVAGRFMKDERFKDTAASIQDILIKYSQEEVFIPEVLGILTNDQWSRLQHIHDNIALDINPPESIERLGLFTYNANHFDPVPLKNSYWHGKHVR